MICICQYLDITSLPSLELPPHFPPRLHDVEPGLKMRAKVIQRKCECVFTMFNIFICKETLYENIVNIYNVQLE